MEELRRIAELGASDSVDACRLAGAAAWTALTVGDVDAARSAVGLAVELAAASADPAQVRWTGWLAAVVELLYGTESPASALVAMAGAAERADDPEGRLRALLWAAHALLVVGDARGARELVEDLSGDDPHLAALWAVLGVPGGRVSRLDGPLGPLTAAAALALSPDPVAAHDALLALRREVPDANRRVVDAWHECARAQVGLVLLRDGEAPALVLDANQRIAAIDGDVVATFGRSKLMFRLARALVSGPVGKETVFEGVWDLRWRPPSSANTLYVAVTRLRHVLAAAPVDLQVGEDGAYALVSKHAVVERRPAREAVGTSVVHGVADPADPFVGRRADLFAVGRAVVDRPVTTLVGPGGAGKTRLAIEVARAAATKFPGGAWFSDLSPAAPGADVVASVTAALGLPGRPGSDDDLARALSRWKPSLVVLDNAEHVLDSVTRLVAALCASAPDVTLLVTSRIPLGVPEEVVHRLEPLEPADAVALFATRARAIRGNVLLEGGNRDVAAAITTALDRLPLAIELAAARVALLSLDELRDRLDRALARRSLANEERHGSFEAAIDWSWDLLSPAERDAFVQTAVFVGGFTPEAAEVVIDVAGDGVPGALELVHRLVERSLVRFDGRRFRVFDTLRAYATAKLEFWPGRAAVELRHAEWFVNRAIRLRGVPDATAFAAWVSDERHNLLAVPDRLRALDADHAARAALMAIEAAHRYSSVADELRLTADALAGPPIDPGLRCELLIGRGPGLAAAGRSDEHRRALWEAVDLAREHGLSGLQGRALSALGHSYATTDPERGLALLAEARELLTAAGDENGIAHCWGYEATNLRYAGDLEGARIAGERAIAAMRTLGDHRSEAVFLGDSSLVLFDLGELDEAVRAAERALRLTREMGDARSEAGLVGRLAAFRQRQGHLHEAIRMARAAVELREGFGDKGAVWSRVLLGTLLVHAGCAEEAREHLEMVDGPPEAYGLAQRAMATLALEHGDTGDALAHAHRAVQVFTELGHGRYRGLAEAVVGLCLLVAGDDAGARAAFDTCLGAWVAGFDPGARDAVVAYAAVIDVWSGEVDRAREAVAGLEVRAWQAGDERRAVHARVARAHVELASGGDPAECRRLLDAVRAPVSPDDRHPAGLPSLAERSAGVRLALRLLERRLGASDQVA